MIRYTIPYRGKKYRKGFQWLLYKQEKTVSNLVNARNDMELTAQEVDNSVSSAAKIRKISDATKFSSKIMTKHENIAIQNVHYGNKIGYFIK